MYLIECSTVYEHDCDEATRGQSRDGSSHSKTTHAAPSVRSGDLVPGEIPP